MSILDTITNNRNRVAYTTLFPSDKILYEGTLQYSLAGGGTTTTQELPNPTGIKCFITLAWSVDGSNYYPMQAYTDASAPYTANAWVSASTIYLYMENYSAGTVTFYLKYALDSIT